VGITDKLLGLTEEKPEPNNSWIKELIDKRYQPKTERLKREPIGFTFKRDPFDPSSYYKDLGSFRDISRAATAVTQQEVANKEQADYERRQEELRNAVGGINPNFNYEGGGDFSGVSRKYHLKKVTPNVTKAADYWGSKYGIKDVGGWREHGSVPGSDHPKGRALDFMTYSNKKQGDALANDLIQNYKAWNIKYVIWNRYIWSPSKGWRRYNGPSPHTDHVHASFNK